MDARLHKAIMRPSPDLNEHRALQRSYGSVALSLCTTACPLYTGLVQRIGNFCWKTAMRPIDPTRSTASGSRGGARRGQTSGRRRRRPLVTLPPASSYLMCRTPSHSQHRTGATHGSDEWQCALVSMHRPRDTGDSATGDNVLRGLPFDPARFATFAKI